MTSTLKEKIISSELVMGDANLPLGGTAIKPVDKENRKHKLFTIFIFNIICIQYWKTLY